MPRRTVALLGHVSEVGGVLDGLSGKVAGGRPYGEVAGDPVGAGLGGDVVFAAAGKPEPSSTPTASKTLRPSPPTTTDQPATMSGAARGHPQSEAAPVGGTGGRDQRPVSAPARRGASDRVGRGGILERNDPGQRPRGAALPSNAPFYDSIVAAAEGGATADRNGQGRRVVQIRIPEPDDGDQAPRAHASWGRC